MTSTALIADIGESFGSWSMGDDEAMLEILTDANVACGFHAGDPLVIEQTVARCRANGVSVGAHPGFHDLRGFGRRTISQSADETRADVLYQLGALSAFTRAHGVPLAHVTVHGAMDNLSFHGADYAEGIARAVAEFDGDLLIVCQGGELGAAAAAHGVRTVSVFMADRSYRDDGQLLDRSQPGAVLQDPALIADRALRAIAEGVVETADGTLLPVSTDAILVHGDSPASVDVARTLHRSLLEEDVRLRSIAELARG